MLGYLESDSTSPRMSTVTICFLSFGDLSGGTMCGGLLLLLCACLTSLACLLQLA